MRGDKQPANFALAAVWLAARVLTERCACAHRIGSPRARTLALHSPAPPPFRYYCRAQVLGAVGPPAYFLQLPIR